LLLAFSSMGDNREGEATVFSKVLEWSFLLGLARYLARERIYLFEVFLSVPVGISRWLVSLSPN
jgi:hypothetical protein